MLILDPVLMRKKLHIFVPGDSKSTNRLAQSSLASERIRLNPAALAAAELGYSVSMGDNFFSDISHALVGKIGANEIERRSSNWLRHLLKLRKNKSQVFLDYTDHHIGSGSLMSGFYEEALPLCSHVVAPNVAMRAVLMAMDSTQPTTVIEDLLEYEPLSPAKKQPLSNQQPALWFGHPSNAIFLADFIDKNAKKMVGHDLVICSLPQTIEILKRHSFQNRPQMQIRFLPWSRDNLLKIAKEASYCVIPSHINSPKRYASNNRLVTALALGLPTIATPIPSYQEFSEYFAEEGTQQADEIMANPNVAHNKIVAFQDTEVSRFQLPSIMGAWQQLLLA